jgi:hypothetical protein
MATIQYNLNDYNAIMYGTYKNDVSNEEIPMSYTLPSSVINIIKLLSNKFGFDLVEKEREKEKGKRLRYPQKPTEDSWINPSGFKPTTIIDKPVGTDKLMNDIRASLNKISNKNYDTNRDIIIGLLNELVNEKKENTETELAKIGNNIFDIASTNKFFSEIYANLYKDISEKFPEIFNNILLVFLEGFTNTMKTIRYVDQKENYDDFCKYNKENDKRKATSMFITNLVKNNVIEPHILIQIIQTTELILDTYMNQENCINEVEEIIENIFILLTNNITFLKSCSNTEIITFIQNLSKIKPKDLPSISSRAIFKCLDILDKLK